MTIFDFYIDQKVTTWNRMKYQVHAETRDDAIQIMKQEFENEENPDNIFIETEILFDAEEVITPEENNNQYTKELLLIEDTGETQILTNYPESNE